MKFSRKCAAAAAILGVVGALASTTPAMAAAGRDSALISTSRGNARFYNVGDKLVTCDTKADGLAASASVSWADSSGNWHAFYAIAPSKGTCKTATKNIPEGTKVYVELDFTSKNNQHGSAAGGKSTGVA